MFSKLSTALIISGIVAQVVVGSPPACLIDAVNTQDNPHDIKGVCSGDAAKEVAKAMSANCGDEMDTATEWFASVCKDAGVTISTSTSSSDSSSTNSASKSSSTESSDSSSSASSGSTGTMTSAESTGTAIHLFGFLHRLSYQRQFISPYSQRTYSDW